MCVPLSQVSVPLAASFPLEPGESPMSLFCANKGEARPQVDRLRCCDLDYLKVRASSVSQEHAPSFRCNSRVLTIAQHIRKSFFANLDEAERRSDLKDYSGRHAGQVSSGFGELSFLSQVFFKSRRRDRKRG